MNAQPQICIFGAGSIGCYIGGRLAADRRDGALHRPRAAGKGRRRPWPAPHRLSRRRSACRGKGCRLQDRPAGRRRRRVDPGHRQGGRYRRGGRNAGEICVAGSDRRQLPERHRQRGNLARRLAGTDRARRHGAVQCRPASRRDVPPGDRRRARHRAARFARTVSACLRAGEAAAEAACGVSPGAMGQAAAQPEQRHQRPFGTALEGGTVAARLSPMPGAGAKRSASRDEGGRHPARAPHALAAALGAASACPARPAVSPDRRQDAVGRSFGALIHDRCA